MSCIYSPSDATAMPSHLLQKMQSGFSFWYRPALFVLVKRSLNDCCCNPLKIHMLKYLVVKMYALYGCWDHSNMPNLFPGSVFAYLVVRSLVSFMHVPFLC